MHQLPKRALLLFILLIFVIYSNEAQVIISPPAAVESTPTSTDSQGKIWLQYHNYFEFRKGMSIDSDFGQQFYLEDTKMRFHVRSIFRAEVAHNLFLGAGMGFFWEYNSPYKSQELRFMQEVLYRNDFEYLRMDHRLRFEERIEQFLYDPNEETTRLRYKFQVTIPTGGHIYYGFSNELFSTLFSRENQTLIGRNRAAAIIGFDSFRLFNLEAQVLREDTFNPDFLLNTNAWQFRLVLHQIL